jgi:hypothetical protein
LQRVKQPALNEILAQAAQALASLEADRLEEMALYCEELLYQPEACVELDGENAVQEMAIFGRVIEATRTNLNVMRRIREVRAAQLEYGRSLDNRVQVLESKYGDH